MIWWFIIFFIGIKCYERGCVKYVSVIRSFGVKWLLEIICFKILFWKLIGVN